MLYIKRLVEIKYGRLGETFTALKSIKILFWCNKSGMYCHSCHENLRLWLAFAFAFAFPTREELINWGKAPRVFTFWKWRRTTSRCFEFEVFCSRDNCWLRFLSRQALNNFVYGAHALRHVKIYQIMPK